MSALTSWPMFCQLPPHPLSRCAPPGLGHTCWSLSASVHGFRSGLSSFLSLSGPVSCSLSVFLSILVFVTLCHLLFVPISPLHPPFLPTHTLFSGCLPRAADLVPRQGPGCLPRSSMTSRLFQGSTRQAGQCMVGTFSLRTS